MGNFTGKEGVDGKDGEQQAIYNADANNRTEPGRPGAFPFQDNPTMETHSGGNLDHMDLVSAGQQLPEPYIADKDVVPTVFRWDHGGGRQVYITGTFNNWEKQIPMHRSGNDFTYIHNLKKGKHAFKFIVDDEWRFAPDQQTIADIEGRINNFIDVSDFKAYTGEDDFMDPKALPDPEDSWSQVRPELEEYTKEPPPLPPHLRHIILNKVSPINDSTALSIPQHVALNHLYCTAIKDGMMVLGITQRFREKFVTTIYYSNI